MITFQRFLGKILAKACLKNAGGSSPDPCLNSMNRECAKAIPFTGHV